MGRRRPAAANGPGRQQSPAAGKELLQILTTDLPALPIQYELQAIPVYGFKGIQPVTGSAHTGSIMHTTEVNLWDLI